MPRFMTGSVLALVGACSLTAVDNADCESNAQCQTAFGAASVCSDGFCIEPQRSTRCFRTYPEDLFDREEAYRDRIVLGSLYSFVDHLDTLLATELAVRQVNDQGGLDGDLFAIVHCDYTEFNGDQLTDEEATAQTASYLADVVNVSAIVGPRGSTRAEVAWGAISDDDVVLISPSATSPALTALEGVMPSDDQPGLLWRTAPPDSLQSEVIASDMLERGVTRVVVLFQTGAYGEGLKGLFVERFLQEGGALAEEFPFTGGGFAPTVAGIADDLDAGTYDEVLFISSDIADHVTFFTAATATDDLEAAFTREGVGIFLTDAAFNAQLLDETVSRSASLYSHVRGTRPAPAEGALFNAFAAAYTAQYNADASSSAFTPHAYDAGWLVIYGMAWSRFNEGRIRGLGIARGLRRLSSGAAINIQPVGWASVLANFRAGTGVDVEGVSGPLDYDPITEETAAPISVWAIVADPGEPSGFNFEELSRTQPE